MKVKFQDPAFSFQFLRVLGSAASRQADVGECFATAERIVEGDFESWTRAWTDTAARLSAAADTSLAAGHRVSASDTYLRAANYYRAAEFYLHGNPKDPRIVELSGESGRCFEAALRNGDRPYRRRQSLTRQPRCPVSFIPAGMASGARSSCRRVSTERSTAFFLGRSRPRGVVGTV